MGDQLRRRTALGLLGTAAAGALVGCDRPVTPPQSSPTSGSALPRAPAESAAPAAPSGAKIPADVEPAKPTKAMAPALRALFDRVLVREAPMQRVLYTWTTPAQIAALRNGGKLLHRSQSATHGRSRFDKMLAAKEAKGQPLAAYLKTPQLSFRRFAWPYPWATLLGFPGETYGDQLLRIELRRCKLASVLVREGNYKRNLTAQSQWDPDSVRTVDVSYFDVDGKALPTAPSLEDVGVIYHEQNGYQTATGTFDLNGSPLREYVLFDERQIANYSYGDQACRDAIQDDIDFLSALITDGSLETATYGAGTHEPAWSKADHRDRGWERALGDAFAANLAFVNQNYTRDAAALNVAKQRLAQALARQGAAFTSDSVNSKP